MSAEFSHMLCLCVFDVVCSSLCVSAFARCVATKQVSANVRLPKRIESSCPFAVLCELLLPHHAIMLHASAAAGVFASACFASGYQHGSRAGTCFVVKYDNEIHGGNEQMTALMMDTYGGKILIHSFCM
jgi:hypothetical protein